MLCLYSFIVACLFGFVYVIVNYLTHNNEK